METALLTWWSVNHFFSGVFFGILFNHKKFKKVGLVKSTIITLFLLILWEFFEFYVTVPLINFGAELIRNRIADVIIGMVGYFIAYYYFTWKKLPYL